MDFDFLTAEMDSPLSLHGAVSPSHADDWEPAQNLGSGARAIAGWISASAIATAWRFSTKTGAIKNYGFLANGNEYNIDANGMDARGLLVPHLLPRRWHGAHQPD